MLNSRLKILIRLCVGVVLLMLLFQVVEWRQALPLFHNIQWGPFILAGALYPVSILISTIKWRSLLLPHEITVSSYELFRHYWTGIFLNNFFPSSVGGDIGRVTLLGRFGRPAEVAASVLVERLTGVCIVLLVATGALAMKPELFRHEWLPLLWVVALALTGGVVGTLFFSSYITTRFPAPSTQSEGWFALFLVKLRKLAAAISLYRQMPIVLWQNLVLSLFFYLLTVLGYYVSFQIFALDLNPVDVFFIAAWITLISFVPISFNGLGMTEGAFVFFFSLAGVLPSEALAVAVLLRFVGLIFSAVGGVFLLFPEKHKNQE